MTTRSAALALFALLASSCDDHVFPTGSVEAGNSDLYTADWDGVQVFFQDNCTAGCHESLAPVLPDAIEADLANGAGELVVPGDPDASLLWQAIDQSGSATPMPIGQPRLDDEFILHVRDWIEAGAEI